MRSRFYLFDILMSIVLLVYFTGGFVWRKASGKPVFEVADMGPLAGVLLFCVFWMVWRRAAFFSVFIDRTLKFISRELSLTMAWVVLLGMAGFFFGFLLVKHFSLHTGFDTAIFDQALFNTSKGDLLYSQIKGDKSLFADHFQPILLALVPLYWIHATPLWLFLAQSFTFVASGIGLFKLCRLKKVQNQWAWLVVIGLFLNRAYQGVILNDFHPISLITPLFIFLLYYLEKSHWVGIFVCSLLSLMVKEYIGIYLVFFGVYFILSSSAKWRFALGSVLIIVAVSHWFWVTKEFMPGFGREFVYGIRYAHLGDTVWDKLSFLMNPVTLGSEIFQMPKIKYVFYILGGVCFLPFFSGWTLILFLPALAQNLLSNAPAQFTLGSHYSAEVVGITFGAAVLGLARLPGRLERLLADNRLQVGVLLVMLAFSGRSPFYDLWRNLLDLQRYQIVSQAKELIDPEITLQAQHGFMPHFSSRNPLYLYPYDQATEATLVSQQMKPWPLSANEFRLRWDDWRLQKSQDQHPLPFESLLLIEPGGG